MKRRKAGFTAIAMLSAALVVSIAGCSAKEEMEGQKENTDGAKKLSVLVEAGSPAYDVAQQTAEEFKELTGIEVEIDAVPYSGMYDKLSAEVTSQAGLYDVACVDTVWLAGLKNGLSPLDTIVTEDMKKDFPESLIKDGTLDGTIYGLPAWANAKVLLYRTDLFDDLEEQTAFQEKYGYELGVPTTWQQYLDTAEFFTRDDDQDGVIDMYGTSLSAKTGGDTVVSFLDFALEAGAESLVTDSENNVRIDETPYLEAINYMKALYDSQCVPAGIFEMAAADHVKMFSEGKLAMAPVWCAMYADAVNQETSQVAEYVGVAMMPEGSAGAGIVPAPFYHVIMKGSNMQEEAAEYLNFIYEKNELYIARGMAGRISVLEANKEKYPQLKVLLDSMQAPQSAGRPKLAQWNEMESAINVMIQRVLKAEITPEEALAELKTELEGML